MEVNITYRSKYKFQLYKDYWVKTNILVNEPVGNDYTILDSDGSLLIKKGYAWDGVTGLFFTPKSLLRATLVHDALYQLMRENRLDRVNKGKADKLLFGMSVKDSFLLPCAVCMYIIVSWFGRKFTDPANDRPILTAPR